ncbi:formate dehydrogenase accessory sulfurtransferase FdhD [Novosphingobium sp. PC22D]|uniref:formate dehydrogenase accessory sulfurtransferase FdhD n=1 Tax=Novosphingobium sp. PC22D TaxID=1962403 RepID=UPI001F0A819B|nr:formate dehydrogenase accessory sulfurtransferase FdhD [Novosphingobium sp. PC22D]
MIEATGKAHAQARAIAREVPVAIELNGIGYAVLMASADDLEDLAYGFARSERLIETAGQVEYVAIHHAEQGVIVRIGLEDEAAARIHDRVRHRTSESSCGLCGIENLEQAMRPLPRLPDAARPEEGAIFAALATLREHQPLNRETGAVHAAALCAADGAIRLVREDVGRHNAFDKLIGAMLRQGLGWDGGFALLSSRCSFELVEKAALSGCPAMVTISAPTTLALDRARQANLPLYVLARSDSLLRA